MRYLVFYIFYLFILNSCNDAQITEKSSSETSPYYNSTLPNIPEDKNRYYGITMINCGPRGGSYPNGSENEISYRIFRVQLINDTVFPIELNINFPSRPVPLSPDSNQSVKVFLFPDELMPGTKQDTYNFGVTGLVAFIDSGLNKPTKLKTLIKPKEERILYIGCLTDGVARAKLFVNGQNHENPFLPVKSITSTTKNNDTLELVFGLGFNPPDRHSLIHCGQITFKK